MNLTKLYEAKCAHEGHRNCFAVLYNFHEGAAQLSCIICSTLFHNYHNAFAKMPMTWCRRDPPNFKNKIYTSMKRYVYIFKWSVAKSISLLCQTVFILTCTWTLNLFFFFYLKFYYSLSILYPQLQTRKQLYNFFLRIFDIKFPKINNPTQFFLLLSLNFNVWVFL